MRLTTRVYGNLRLTDIDSTTTKTTILTAWFEMATACSIVKKTPKMAEGISALKATVNLNSKASLLTDGCFQ